VWIGTISIAGTTAAASPLSSCAPTAGIAPSVLTGTIGLLTASHELKRLIVNMLKCVAEAEVVHSLDTVLNPHFLGNMEMSL
jgi:hypothetical protein